MKEIKKSHNDCDGLISFLPMYKIWVKISYFLLFLLLPFPNQPGGSGFEVLVVVTGVGSTAGESSLLPNPLLSSESSSKRSFESSSPSLLWLTSSSSSSSSSSSDASLSDNSSSEHSSLDGFFFLRFGSQQSQTNSISSSSSSLNRKFGS